MKLFSKNSYLIILLCIINTRTVRSTNIAQLFDWNTYAIQDDCHDFEFLHHLINRDLDDDNWLNQEKIAVSLGYNCTVTNQLLYEHVRIRAFPFDWCISSITGIIKCINDNFNNFLSLENLSFFPETNWVHDAMYQISIPHDFPFQHPEEELQAHFKSQFLDTSSIDIIREQYNQVYEKFMRRIERFRKLKAYQGKLYFFRCGNITKKEAVALFKALYKQFKKQDFVLVVIESSDEFKKSWRLPQLKNFFIENAIGRVFEKDLLTHIFKEVGLL